MTIEAGAASPPSSRVMLLQERVHRGQERDPVLLAREEMVAERLLDIDKLLACLLQPVRHLARLLDRDSLVRLAVDQQHRNRELLGEVQWRDALEIGRLL